MLRDFVAGDQSDMRKYLIQYESEKGQSEGEKAFALRKQLTYYDNLQEKILNAWLSFLFRQDPSYEGLESFMKPEEMEDVDGCGCSLTDFIKNHMTRSYLQYGPTYVETTAPNIVTSNKAQDDAIGKRVFLKGYEPLGVPEWETEESDPSRKGKLNAIQFEYILQLPRTSFEEESKLTLYRKQITREGQSIVARYFRIEDNDFDINSFSHDKEYDWKQDGEDHIYEGFSEIPVQFAGKDSWLKDSVHQNHRLYNLRSAHEWILHQSSYKKLWASGEPLDPKDFPWSVTNMFWIKQGGTIGEIAPTDPVALRDRCTELEDKVWAIGMNQMDRLPGDSRAAQSDATIKEQKDIIIAIAKATVSQIETWANAIVRDIAEFKGHTLTEDEKITLNADFDDSDYDKLVETFVMLRGDLEQLPTFRKKAIQKLSLRYEFDEDTQKDINDEIEGMALSSEDKAEISRSRILEAVSSGSDQS